MADFSDLLHFPLFFKFVQIAHGCAAGYAERLADFSISPFSLCKGSTRRGRDFVSTKQRHYPLFTLLLLRGRLNCRFTDTDKFFFCARPMLPSLPPRHYQHKTDNDNNHRDYKQKYLSHGIILYHSHILENLRMIIGMIWIGWIVLKK